MRAVIYARRSTEKQATSVPVQISEATKFIESKGWTLVGTYRDDEGSASRKEFKKRREFLRMLGDASEDLFDVVVTRDNTRLGGDTSRTMRAIEDLKDEGVAVWYYFHDREVKLGTWIEKASFAMESAAAEGERDNIAGRTFENLKKKAEAKKNVGGRCYGYTNVRVFEGPGNSGRKLHTDYTIEPKEAAIVVEIFERYAKGEGYRGIARLLNQRAVPAPRAGKRGTGSWAPSCIRAILLRPRYVGAAKYGESMKTYRKGTKVRVEREDPIEIDAPELRIVPQPLWAAVQERFHRPKRQGRAPQGRKPVHLLSSLARCSECGGPIHARNGRSGQKGIKVYMCGYFHDRAACDVSLRRPVEEVDAALVEWLSENLLSETIVLKILGEVRRRAAKRSKGSENEIDQLSAEATQLRKEVGNLAEAIARTGGSVEVLADKLKLRQSRLTAIDARLAFLKTAPDVISLEVRRLEGAARKRIAELQGMLERGPAEARHVLESLLGDDRLQFHATQTPEGPRFKVQGRIATGAVLSVLSGLSVKGASPAGFENEGPAPKSPKNAGKPADLSAHAQPSSVPASARADSEADADPVEAALTDALAKASAAGAWTAVEALSRELTARREARAGVVDLGAARKRRDGGAR